MCTFVFFWILMFKKNKVCVMCVVSTQTLWILVFFNVRVIERLSVCTYKDN